MRPPARLFALPVRWVLPFAAAVCAAGCGPDKPRAPALTTEAVYQNDDVGLRFVAPEGWTVYAKSSPPSGPVGRPVRLVAYVRVDGETKADLELYALDLPNGKDLLTYLVESPLGPEKWVTQTPPGAETVAGVGALRSAQVARHGRADVRRDLVSVPRRGRTLVFIVTSQASDTLSRDQATRAIASTTWVGGQ